MLRKISEKIGFTYTEIKVILFLLIVLTVGFGYKSIFLKKTDSGAKIYDYSRQDSIFDAYHNSEKILPESEQNGVQKVDYKPEVLDFNKPDFNATSSDTKPHENGIDLNKAGLNDLIKLPGIGSVTAERIIKYRSLNDGFDSLNELTKIKGIGSAKLKKIKKYLYIGK